MVGLALAQLTGAAATIEAEARAMTAALANILLSVLLVVVRECSSDNCQKTVVEQTITGVSAARFEVAVKVLKDGERILTTNCQCFIPCWMLVGE